MRWHAAPLLLVLACTGAMALLSTRRITLTPPPPNLSPHRTDALLRDPHAAADARLRKESHAGWTRHFHAFRSDPPALASPKLTDRNAERDALVQVYNACGGTDWFSAGNWTSSVDYCDWEGVYCTQGGSVFGLDLVNENLQGTLPDVFDQLPNTQILVCTFPSTLFLPRRSTRCLLTNVLRCRVFSSII
jgi:hypothetical protein